MQNICDYFPPQKAQQQEMTVEDSRSYLPSYKACLAQEMATGLDTSVFIPLDANLT